MPHVFGHGSVLKWSERQDFHLRPPGPRPGALKTELRSDETGGSEGTRTLSLPADNGLLWLVELRIRKMACQAEALGEGWWEVLVMLQSSLPAFVFDTGFTDRQPEHLPNW